MARRYRTTPRVINASSCYLTARTRRRSPLRARAGARRKPKASRQLTGRQTRTAAGRRRPELGQARAKKRAGAPGAAFTLGTPAINVAPVGGTWSRFARFSIPQRPDGSQTVWVLKS